MQRGSRFYFLVFILLATTCDYSDRLFLYHYKELLLLTAKSRTQPYFRDALTVSTAICLILYDRSYLPGNRSPQTLDVRFVDLINYTVEDKVPTVSCNAVEVRELISLYRGGSESIKMLKSLRSEDRVTVESLLFEVKHLRGN